jgi:hypothetical protein
MAQFDLRLACNGSAHVQRTLDDGSADGLFAIVVVGSRILMSMFDGVLKDVRNSPLLLVSQSRCK